MKYQVSGQVLRTSQGTVSKGEKAGTAWHRVEVAEMGATHSIPVNAVDAAQIKKGAMVVIAGDTIQRHNARGQYVNEGYELGEGTLLQVDGQPVKKAA